MGRAHYAFEDETVIVTGGASGIGRGIALNFGAAGATVVVADIRETPKDVGESTPTHEAIDDDGAGRGVYVETDVSDPAQLEAVVEAAREFGGVDVMVNNAGWFKPADLEDTSVEDFRRIHRINVDGVFFGCQAAARDMRERDAGGCIVNTASISSELAQPGQIGYDSTKGAIRMITRGAALELAPEIRVNAVAPGHIATEFGSGAANKEAAVANDELLKPIPMQRPGYPDDIADAACFLASEQARYVTGELLFVDGGWQAF